MGQIGVCNISSGLSYLDLAGEDAVLDDALDSGMDSLYDEEDEAGEFEESEREESQEDDVLAGAASIDVDKTAW